MVKPQEIFLNGVDRTQEIVAFADHIGLDQATDGRYSLLFLAELYFRAVVEGNLHPEWVLDEIKYLEGTGGPTGTKTEAPFIRDAALSGLWHKHYREAGVSSMSMNLMIALKRYGIPSLEVKVAAAEAAGEDRFLSAEDIGEIVNDVVNGNYGRRVNDNLLTGEWIVYANHSGENYYLCLAKHDTGAQNIRQKIESICVPEYPFLTATLQPQA